MEQRRRQRGGRSARVCCGDGGRGPGRRVLVVGLHDDAPPAGTTPVDGSRPRRRGRGRPATGRRRPRPPPPPSPGRRATGTSPPSTARGSGRTGSPLPGATADQPGADRADGSGLGPGAVTPTSSTVGFLGALDIASLQDAGYNVLTWDPRGFGQSTGTVETDSADFEGKRRAAAARLGRRPAGVQLDGTGDPRVGMVGGSYGGGIQIVTAAIDCRVDAIVPIDRLALAADEPLQGRHASRPGGRTSSSRPPPGARSTRTSPAPTLGQRHRHAQRPTTTPGSSTAVPATS